MKRKIIEVRKKEDSIMLALRLFGKYSIFHFTKPWKFEVNKYYDGSKTYRITIWFIELYII